MAIDTTDLLRRLTARRREDADPLDLAGVDSATLPRAEFVPPGTPDVDPLGLAGVTPEAAGLPLPADPGPRAPEGVLDPLGLRDGSFAVNRPPATVTTLSGQQAIRDRLTQLDRPSRGAGLLEVLARLDPNYQQIQESRARVKAAQQTQAAQTLKALVEGAEKLTDNPDLAPIFKDVFKAAYKSATGADLADEDYALFTSTKGLATDVTAFEDEMGPEFTRQYLADVRREKDPAKRLATREKYTAIAKRDALARILPQVRQALQTPTVRAQLADADGTITQTAVMAALDDPQYGLRRFEREALRDYFQGSEGQQALTQLGVEAGSLTFEAKKAEATREDKAGALSQAVRDVLRGAPFGLKNPDKEATPEQIAKAEQLVSARKDQRARELGTARFETTGIPAELANQIATLNTMLISVEESEALFKPDYVGPIAGRVAGVTERTTGNISDEEVEFRAIVKSMSEDLLRAKSGAQINEQEYQRLLSFLPDVNLPPNVFQSRVRRFKRYVQQLLEEKRRAAGLTRGDVRGGSAPTRQILGEPEEIE